MFSKNAERLLDRHVEHVGHVLALVRDLERLAVVARALADLARHVDVGQEVHLDLDLPVALARLAAPAVHVEAEPARRVAARLRLGRGREERADVVPHARCTWPGCDRGVRPMGDWSMAITLSMLPRPSIARVLAGAVARAVDRVAERGRERVGDERALARAAHAGHDRRDCRAGSRRRCP